MNTRQGKRKTYVKLETAVIVISENESLLAGSGMDGGAGSAGNDGPGLNAKEFDFFSDEEENSASKD